MFITGKKLCNHTFLNELKIIVEQDLQVMWCECVDDDELDKSKSVIKTSILHSMIEKIMMKIFLAIYGSLNDFEFKTEKYDAFCKYTRIPSKYPTSSGHHPDIDLEIRRKINDFMITIQAKAPMTSIKKNVENFFKGFMGAVSGYYNENELSSGRRTILLLNCVPIETITLNKKTGMVSPEYTCFKSAYNFNEEGVREKDVKLSNLESDNLVEININYKINVDFNSIYTKKEFNNAIRSSKKLISLDMESFETYINHFLYFFMKKQNDSILDNDCVVPEPMIPIIVYPRRKKREKNRNMEKEKKSMPHRNKHRNKKCKHTYEIQFTY